MKHLFTFLLLPFFFAACGGGGGSGGVIEVELWGDSIPAGTYGKADGSVGVNAVTPTARINELGAGRFVAVSRARPGMTTAMALKLLSSTFPSSYAKIIVFRFGVADAVLAVSPAEFKANLLELVHLAKASGKTVLLVEPSSVPAIANTLVAPMRSVVAEVAKSEQVPLVILHDLPWATPDGLHPDQATADLYAGRIVTSLLGML